MEKGYGSQEIDSTLSEFQALEFFIDNKILEINTLKICKVTKVNAKTLNVKPLVLKLDGEKKPIPATEYTELPIMQTQGGTGAFVIEYNVGDIVLVGFCDRDTQSVVRSKKESAPSTYTPFPLSSGLVLGAVLFANAQVYLKVTDKVYCVGNFDVSLNANIQGNLKVGGDVTTTGKNDAASYSVGGTAGATLTFTDLAGNSHSVVNGIIVS